MPSCPNCHSGRATRQTIDGRWVCGTCLLKLDAKARARAEAANEYKAMVKQLKEEMMAAAKSEAAAELGKGNKK
jgi:ribosomal protein L37AE/L43A